MLKISTALIAIASAVQLDACWEHTGPTSTVPEPALAQIEQIEGAVDETADALDLEAGACKKEICKVRLEPCLETKWEITPSNKVKCKTCKTGGC